MKRYRLLVESRELPADLETPVGIYLKIRDLYPQSALLESSDYHASQNSVSYIGVDPIGSFTVARGVVTAVYPDGVSERAVIGGDVDVIERLRDYMGSFAAEGDTAPDVNGLLGYTAYDAVRYFERVSVKPRERGLEDVPDMMYLLYRFVIKVNHYRNTMTVYEHRPEGERSRIDGLTAIIGNNNTARYAFEAVGGVTSPVSDDDYRGMVERGKAHVRRGDVFQVVLSRRFSQRFRGDEFNVYRALRSINPSPYLFFFDFGGFKVFGSSPETHLRVTGTHACIDPIAGTFRRSGDARRDRELAEALLADEKENAEHIMLVDLARNDLSRGGGKVSIEFLKQIQYYSHVIHMVSRVGAELPTGADTFRLYAGTFPAGTLSGAPKVRAMELIDEIEPHSRVTYAGCIGFAGFNGDLNQAITIRSFLSHGNTLYWQAGAGVVARSVPENELQETNNKLGALVGAIKLAEKY